MSDKSAFDKEGSVGSAFKSKSSLQQGHLHANVDLDDGSVGGKAEQVGGPLSSEGSVGKQFTDKGAVGGTAQNAAEQAQGDKPSMFDAKGAIGKQFTSMLGHPSQRTSNTNTSTAAGAIGGTAQAVGGPFDKDGMIGKHFKQDGAVGGSVQGSLGDQK